MLTYLITANSLRIINFLSGEYLVLLMPEEQAGLKQTCYVAVKDQHHCKMTGALFYKAGVCIDRPLSEF